MPGGNKKGGGLEYQPFKMKGTPFQRNFGIGRTESPNTETPLNQIDLSTAISNIGKNINENVKNSGGWGKVVSKSLAAGMRTLKGGYDAYSKDTKVEEPNTSEAMKDLIEQINSLDKDSEEYKNITEDPNYLDMLEMFPNLGN